MAMTGQWLPWMVVGINVFFFAQALLNIAYLRRATSRPRVLDGPLVSVIVPARDEEHSIARCLESLLRQEYANYEVIAVDDDSGDATPQIMSDLAEHNPRLRVVTAEPLPDGWLGKPHALAAGVAAAHGDILILTDADTAHSPQSVSWAVTNLEDHRADMVSGYLAQQYGSLGEAIVVPSMYAAMMLVPFYLLPRSRNPELAFAIGQFVAYRREALDGVGGIESICGSLVDDMAMAKRLKRFGYRGVFLDARQAATCRLYTGYSNAFVGITRSIYSAVGGNPVSALVVSALVLGAIVAPTSMAIVAGSNLQTPSLPIAMSAGLFVALWGLVSWDRHVPFSAFVLYPVVFLNLVLMLLVSMVRTGFGNGVLWKGRKVRAPRKPVAGSEVPAVDSTASGT